MRRTETIEWRPFPRFKPAEDGHYLVDLVKGAKTGVRMWEWKNGCWIFHRSEEKNGLIKAFAASPIGMTELKERFPEPEQIKEWKYD